MNSIQRSLHIMLLLGSTLLALHASAHAGPQLSGAVALPGDLALAPSAGDQSNVAIARGQGQSLMVWEDSRAALVETVDTGGYGPLPIDLFAARIDSNGNLLDTSPIRISTAPFRQHSPRVAWNGSSYLVVWTSRRTQQYSTTEGIYAARVSSAGNLLDDPPLRVNDDDSIDEMFPVVASDGVDWAVAWADRIGNDPIVGGCIVSAAGVVGPSSTLFPSPVPAYGLYTPTNFEMAFTQGRYLFVSEHYFYPGGSGSEIFGQLFAPNLSKIGAEFTISGSSVNGGVKAAVAENGSEFAVVWTGGSIRATPVSSSGTVVVPGGIDLAPGAFLLDPHPSVAWDGANWLAAFELNDSVAATTFSSAGAFVSGPFALDPAGNFVARPAAVAANGGVVVAWSDARNHTSSLVNDWFDLYGSFVATGGNVTALGSLSMSPPAQVEPDIAGSAASGYLVVFESEDSAGTRIVAQRLSPSGAVLDPEPIMIAAGGRTLRTPAVAWNGAEWLVVWEELLGGWPGWTANVWGRRVLPNGSVLDASPILILAGNTPDVSALGSVFLVVSSNEPINHVKYIMGRRVGGDGALLDAAPLTLSGSYAIVPSVAAFADRWLVAWESHSTHDNPYSSVRANIVMSNGTAQGVLSVGTAALYNERPSTAVDGAQALVAWGDGSDIRAGRVLPNGTLRDGTSGFALSSASNEQFGPGIGWDGVQYLAVWNDFRAHGVLEAGIGDLFATHVDANANVLDPGGLTIAADPAVAESSPAVAGDQGKALVVFSAMLADPYGTFRVQLRGPCGGTLAYCLPKTNSLGCVPSISSSGEPSATSLSGFTLNATQVRNQKAGLLIYTSSGRATSRFGGGTLCIAGPIRRSTSLNSGGTSLPASDCSGVYSLDMNAFAHALLGGAPAPFLTVPGTVVDCQFWGRDPGFPAPDNVTLTAGLEYVICL